MDIEAGLICDIESDERQGAKPDDHGSFKLELEQSEKLTQRKHQNSPEVISWEYPKQLPHFPIVIGVVEVIKVEQPEGGEKHQDDIDPGLLEGGKAEEKLADDLISDKDNLALGGSAGG